MGLVGVLVGVWLALVGVWLGLGSRADVHTMISWKRRRQRVVVVVLFGVLLLVDKPLKELAHEVLRVLENLECDMLTLCQASWASQKREGSPARLRLESLSNTGMGMGMLMARTPHGRRPLSLWWYCSRVTCIFSFSFSNYFFFFFFCILLLLLPLLLLELREDVRGSKVEGKVGVRRHLGGAAAGSAAELVAEVEAQLLRLLDLHHERR